MNADSKILSNSFAEQLSSFDARLKATANDVDLLADIQSGIGRLLTAKGSSEAEIRKILQERYEQGGLREETYQLVKSMLDRFETEDVPTTPTPPDLASMKAARSRDPFATAPRSLRQSPAKRIPPQAGQNIDDEFSSTTVIAPDIVANDSADATPQVQVQVGSVLRDRFLLQEKLAGGSMGVVYKALDRRLAEAGSKDQWVAIKVISPQLASDRLALRALQQEAAKGRCLVHPNIVRFIDMDRDDDLYFLVMEWMPGRTLANLLDSKDPSVSNREAALRIVRQVGEALDYAHRCGIIHADVKPGNIMILPDGNAKLFDFGVARVRQQQHESEFDPGVLGALTPAYSSMQVLTGEEPVASDDVFSLGCLMYRLIAGYRVFGPRNAAEASQEGMMPQPVKGLSSTQWSALKKALSYSRVARFNSVREFIDALDVVSDEPIHVAEHDRFTEFEETSNTGKWLLGLLAAVGLAAGAAYQYGYLTPIMNQLQELWPSSDNRLVVIEDPLLSGESAPVAAESDPPAISSGEATDYEASDATPIGDSAIFDEFIVDVPAATSAPVLTVADDNVGPDPMLVDFSALPPATDIVRFSTQRRNSRPFNVTIREDGPDVILDLVRSDNLSVPITLRLEEIGFSGNRSPWAAGQYAISNAGLIHYSSGQARGRITLTMASDQTREADQQSTLRLRDAELVDSELAIINLKIEDDDQREFEASLAPNTVAFAVARTSVRERDPAVQIDLVRFNPDGKEFDIGFTFNDVTATEGRDYFAPATRLTLGPWQRAARLLIPLVQDAEYEGDEEFEIVLDSDEFTVPAGVARSIVVTIHDDDPQAP